MCGAVRFTAQQTGDFGVCHCSMCRRWLGAAMFAVTVPEAAMKVDGGEHVASLRSSDWATRSWCAKCGSGLWYRYDKGLDGTGNYEVPVGLFDEADDFRLKREIFADQKPASWALEGDHERLDSAQTSALYG
ncbi:hypothetical protein OG2516_10411 [Oceanicola granulosus HTCC2516]|uniref:CENP-V/GFA domain-containing protein n=2 Tax=Oceanicola granulosus TaxID=252302 RepID=Q2CKC1_OCEGH|nr:hypothetical protein OG2516_10411 [Oceanicola granulosus HTCC2516]